MKSTKETALHKNNYGGKRKGAGRKKSIEKVYYTIRITPATKRYIKNNGGSSWIEKTVNTINDNQSNT